MNTNFPYQYTVSNIQQYYIKTRIQPVLLVFQKNMQFSVFIVFNHISRSDYATFSTNNTNAK